MIISIDIGGTHIRFAVLDDAADRILYRHPNIATPSQDRDAMVQTLQKELKNVLVQMDNSASPKLIAISSAGLVNPQTGQVVALSPKALPAFATPFPLEQSFCKVLGDVPVFSLNDGQAAAYGEFSEACKQTPDLQNFLFITVSTGTGGGLVLNGKLLMGKTGKAGHIGLALMSAGQAANAYEDLERLEDFTAGRMMSEGSITVKDSAKTLSCAIANYTMGLDLEQVVLGGGVVLNNSDYIAQVTHYINKLPKAYQVPVKTAQLGDDAGLYGAARYALNERLKIA